MNKEVSFYLDTDDDEQLEVYEIVEMGKKRSVIQDIESKKIYLVENNYLMFLDEMGVII